MPKPNPQYFDRTSRVDATASRHINIIGHYTDDTLLDKSGKLIKIIKLAGIDATAQSPAILDIFKQRLNSLFKTFSSEYALYFWTLRRKSTVFPVDNFTNEFAKNVNTKYQTQIENSPLYQNTLYIAIVTKPPEGMLHRGFHWIKSLQSKVDKTAKQNELAKRAAELDQITLKLINTLSIYQPTLLTIEQDDEKIFSQPLTLLARIINFDSPRLPLLRYDAAPTLPQRRLFFNRRVGTMELRAANQSAKFAAMLSIKDYAAHTYQGCLDVLNTLHIEYTLTQSFRFYDQAIAKTKLRDQQKDLIQSKDESISQTIQIDEAVDAAASGNLGFGSHHFSLVCYADTQEELNKNVGLITAALSNCDMICVREDIASECAFWAQLPGNFGYIARCADISTMNMAGLASLHNAANGKLNGNHWGSAVTVFETLAGSPYYFNFHYKDVGNFLVFGSMGSGKTVLIGFLILQSMKFGGKRVIFDKDRGLEILVRALGGVYETIKPGVTTGFNPCQLADTPENRKFLSVLFNRMLRMNDQTLTENDLAVIEQAITGLYQLPQTERQLCHIATFFGAPKSGSLRARFDLWHSHGVHAWLFDNAVDNLNLDSDVLGFDLGHILKETDTKTPALLYLTHRVTQALEGQRGLLFCDEGWQALDDPYFSELINNWSRTPRKLNNIFGLATQSTNDTVNIATSKAINESAVCKIFFPNPQADKFIYCDHLGLTEHEYHLIKTLPDDQHYFLLSHGSGVNKNSVVLRANLSGLADEVAIISAREHTLKILDKLRQTYENPDEWLPMFHAKRLEVSA